MGTATNESDLNRAIETFNQQTAAGMQYYLDSSWARSPRERVPFGLPLDLLAINNANSGVSVVIDGGGGTLGGAGLIAGCSSSPATLRLRT